MKTTKSGAIASAVVAVFGIGSSLTHAQVENNDDEGNVFLEEQIITGTKKAEGESAQDAEISITAFGGEQLEALQFRTISDLSFKIPNVQLDDIGTVKGIANFSVRGLGVNSSIPSIDPAVGVFVDGVYLGVNTGVVFDTFDIAGVETLRGPQGVLFGRNVTGGAVLVNTGDPTDEFYLKTKFSADSGFIGTGENLTGSVVVSGPLGAGFKGKAAVYRNDDAGWHENLFDGSNFGESETTVGRLALEFETDGFDIIAKVEAGDSEGDGPAAQSHVNGVGVASFATNFGPLFLPPDTDFAALTFDRDTFDFAINQPGFQETEWANFSLRADIALGNGKLTNIFGLRDLQQDGLSDIDGSIITIFDGLFNVDQEQISNELRYNASYGDGVFDLTLGAFYFQQDLQYEEQRRVFSADAGGILNFDGGGVLDHETFGLFAAGELFLTEKLSINAGVRYTDETKDADIAQIELLLDPAVLAAGGTAPEATFACFIFNGGPDDALCELEEFPEFSTSNLSPKLGWTFQFDDRYRIYGQYSRAFRAGGFNLRNTEFPDGIDPAAAPGDLGSPENPFLFFGAGPFEDEQIDSFEIGFKSEPADGYRVNLAVFFNRIQDLQREVNLPGGTAVVQQIITNAADAEIRGIELDLQLPVSDNVILYSTLGYLEGEFTAVTLNLSAPDPAALSEPAGPDDLSLGLPRLAPFSATAGVTYLADLGRGDIVVNLNYAHRAESPFTDNNLGFIDVQNRYDASVTYTLDDPNWSFTIFGKNLSDEVSFGGDTQLSNGTFSPLSKGRVVGLEVDWQY